MTVYLPQTLDELEQISGFGKSKVESYGDEFLSVIKEYSRENNLSSTISEKIPKRRGKQAKKSRTDTRAETFDLYIEGKTVDEIAKQRNLTVQTIEGHLAYYVQNGLIKIDNLVSREKIVLIEPVAREFKGGSITPIREKLGNAVGFGEIRLVLAWLSYQKSSAHVNH